MRYPLGTSLWREQRGWLQILVMAIALWLCPTAAEAQQVEAARQAYGEALELVDRKRFEEALQRFKRAYELSPHYAVLFNIGQAYVILDEPLAAIGAFRRYLEQGGDNIEPARRQEVERLIAHERSKVFALEVSVEPDGATLHLNGEQYGQLPLSAPVLLEPGRYELRVEREGFRPVTTPVNAAAGGQKSLRFILEPARVPNEALPQVVPVERRAEEAGTSPDVHSAGNAVSRTAEPLRSNQAWRAVAVVGASVAVVGGVVVIQSALEFQRLSDLDRPNYDDTNLQRRSDIGWAMLTGGVVVFGTSFALEAAFGRKGDPTSSRAQRDNATLRISLAPSSACVAVRF